MQRQYTGTAGRIENAQVDRELYLPKSWTDDPERCQAAGIPEGTKFATKPHLARPMIERAIPASVPFTRVASDEVYGDNRPLRGSPYRNVRQEAYRF